MHTRYPGVKNEVMAREDGDHNVTHNVTPGEWRDVKDLPDITRHLGGNRDTLAAKDQRVTLKAYYNSDAGAVAWQERMI